MKLILLLFSMSALISIFTSCNVDSTEMSGIQLELLPIVKVTQNNYGEEQIRQNTPDSTLFSTFCETYNDKYSDDLKVALVNNMKNQAFKLGEDSEILEKCMNATGRLEKGVISLPYLAEKAKYNDRVSWRIEYAWGMRKDDLGHFKCSVMDAINQDTLLYITCK